MTSRTVKPSLDIFIERVQEIFSVLDGLYVEDQAKELHGSLRATFDGAYETKFVVVDNEAGLPVNRHAVLKTYEAAEQCVKILGDDKHTIGYLLTEK